MSEWQIDRVIIVFNIPFFIFFILLYRGRWYFGNEIFWENMRIFPETNIFNDAKFILLRVFEFYR